MSSQSAAPACIESGSPAVAVSLQVSCVWAAPVIMTRLPAAPHAAAHVGGDAQRAPVPDLSSLDAPPHLPTQHLSLLGLPACLLIETSLCIVGNSILLPTRPLTFTKAGLQYKGAILSMSSRPGCICCQALLPC